MPSTLADPLTADEPRAVAPELPNPALDDSNFKSIAAKFKELWPNKPAEKPNDTKPATSPPPDPQPPARDKGVESKTPPPAPGDTKPPAVDPAPTDDVPDLKPGESPNREHFKRLAQSQRAFKEQAAKLKAEHEAALALTKTLEAERDKLKAALPPNLDEVQKSIADAARIAEENAKLTAEIEALSLERSPKFRAWWESETTKHVKVAQAHVPAEKRAEIAKLLMEAPSSERDAAIDAILDPLSATSRRLATSALENIETLRIQRDEALANGSAKWRELQAHEAALKADEAKARDARLSALTDEALKVARTHSAFQPTGDATRDAELPQREAFVRAAMRGQIDAATAMLLPALAVQAHEQSTVTIPALKAELAKQAELIKQLQGSGARASEGSADRKPPADDNKDGTSFAQRVAQLMRK